jgi:surface antigen
MGIRARVLGFPRAQRLVAAIVLSSAVGLVGGCAELDKFSKEQLGTGIGALAGGLLGTQIGEGRGRLLATAIGTAAGAWIGNRIGAYLDEQDRQHATAAVQLATVTGSPQAWQNPETGVSGRAEVVGTKTTRQTVAVPVFKDRVQQVPPLELIGEPYRATSGANVRGGPGADYVIVGSLSRDETVMVAGKAEGEPWYMVSQGGAGSGFVNANLLTPAPTAVAAAETPAPAAAAVEVKTVAAAQTCRTVRQTVTLADGSTHEEDVTACQSPKGWEIA